MQRNKIKHTQIKKIIRRTEQKFYTFVVGSRVAVGTKTNKMVVPTMDKLPRVPDAHGDVVDEKIFSDLYIRTSWVDANIALDQINKVRHNIQFTHLSIYIYILNERRKKKQKQMKHKTYSNKYNV